MSADRAVAEAILALNGVFEPIPEWATHVAQDYDGAWYAYIREPYHDAEDDIWGYAIEEGNGALYVHHNDEDNRAGRAVNICTLGTSKRPEDASKELYKL